MSAANARLCSGAGSAFCYVVFTVDAEYRVADRAPDRPRFVRAPFVTEQVFDRASDIYIILRGGNQPIRTLVCGLIRQRR